MIYKSIIQNNIKSNIVVIDTSELIQNTDDLMDTKKDIYVMIGTIEEQLMRTAANGSFLNKLTNKLGNKIQYIDISNGIQEIANANLDTTSKLIKKINNLI